MDKILMIIWSVVKKSVRILIFGVIFNIAWLLFSIFYLSNYVSRIWIICSIAICIIFPFIYIIALKINIIPMATDALFKSYENDIDSLSEELSGHVVVIHHNVDAQLNKISPKTIWIIKKLIAQLLNMNIDVLFESLPGDDPATQKMELQNKLNETIKEKINTGSSWRWIVIINIVIVVTIFIVGTIM